MIMKETTIEQRKDLSRGPLSKPILYAVLLIILSSCATAPLGERQTLMDSSGRFSTPFFYNGLYLHKDGDYIQKKVNIRGNILRAVSLELQKRLAESGFFQELHFRGPETPENPGLFLYITASTRGMTLDMDKKGLKLFIDLSIIIHAGLSPESEVIYYRDYSLDGRSSPWTFYIRFFRDALGTLMERVIADIGSMNLDDPSLSSIKTSDVKILYDKREKK